MPERWSWSRLTSLMRCGERFRREREERLPPTSAMLRGSAFHHVAAVAHSRQIEARKMAPTALKQIVLRESLPTPEEAGDLAATRFDQSVRADGVAVQEADEPPKKVVGRDKDAAVRMSRFYVSPTGPAPYLDPVNVEQKIEVAPRNADIVIVGVTDLETVDSEGKNTVRDLKTSERKPGPNIAHESGQLTMYALLKKYQTGKIPHRMALDYVVTPTKQFSEPFGVSFETVRTQADLDVMVARLNNAIEAARAGVFLANGVGQWWCSPKWCPFHSTCRFVRGGE